MTVRSEILAVARAFEQAGNVPFTPAAIIAEVERRGTSYRRSSIRTHIVSAMCIDAPANHQTRYADLTRVGRGLYRLTPTAGGTPIHAR